MTVSGHQEPAFTVASPAMITAWRPSIIPMPVIDAEAGGFAIVLVVGQQESDFEERRAGIDQCGDAFARGHLTGAVLALDLGGTAAGAQALFELFQLFDEVAHVGHACNFGRSFRISAHVM